VAIFSHELHLAIYLMLLTLAIDSTDGALARLAQVEQRIPWFDGRRLDDICDFFTYVIVPACFLIEAELLPHAAWVAAPVLASCYGFSHAEAKTPDYCFRGFPSYWNVVAIYLYLLDARPIVGLGIVLVLALGVFVPLRYLYPSRTRLLRPLTLAVLGTWVLVLAWIGVRPDPDPIWVRWTLLGPAYYLGLSAIINLQRSVRTE
jgi:phosphatidylcholine synthase